MTLYFDPRDPHLREKVMSLSPTHGYVVFVDIKGSTALKDSDFHRWASLIHNAFANIRTFMVDEAFPLKCIGDELMYFIPGDLLKSTGQVPLQLFEGLVSVLADTDPLFPPQKAAIVEGEAYEMTFVEGVPDVYGKDVDLAARLCSMAESRELLMNRAFRDTLEKDFQLFGGGGAHEAVQRITPKGPQGFKGFSTKVEVFAHSTQPPARPSP